jgi:hypothetical protein
VLFAVADGPAYFGGIRFGPPTVQLREIQASIDQNFHAARSAGFPRPPRCVDPHVDTVNQFLGQEHVVIAEKDDSAADFRPTDEFVPRWISAWPGKS